MDRPTGFHMDEITYRRTDENLLPRTEVGIPLRPEKRKKTDNVFIYILLAGITGAILLSIIALIVTKYGVDQRRLELSHQNEFEDCDVQKIGWKLALITFISLGLTIIMATLYRYATSFVVWGILIAWWGSLFIATLVTWFFANSWVPKLVMTILTVILLCVLIFVRDKIHLATMLFRESAKATFHVKAVFSVAVVTALLLLVVVVIYVTASVYIVYGTPISNTIVASIIFNTIVTSWVLEFLASIQYLIVSGAVTKWYFTRNKELLGDPVYTSCYVTLKYHIGTAALGSLIVTVVGVLRALIRNSLENTRFEAFACCCCTQIEEFIKICTKNTFIVTAMHGTPFIQSGKQAVKLLTLNICNTISISSFGEFVLATSGILIVGLSVAISYFLLNLEDKYCLIIVTVISLLCCCPVLGIFETSFCTLFLCTCQDFLINNGNDKPYAMTRDLMKFLEGSKKVFAKTIEKNNLPKL